MSKIKIAHRGNISGPNKDFENHPEYIAFALNNGYHAEIDVWYLDGKIFLGHDNPQYEIDLKFLDKDNLWCHAKTIESLYFMLKLPFNHINCFFHDTDLAVLTSYGYIWTYPKNSYLTNKSIAVMPELVDGWDLSNALGICSDFPDNY